MTLLTPLAGALLAAAVIPPLLLLYFLRLRRKSIRVPSTMLWENATEDLRANAPFQRLRPSWLLLLQLLALLLLAAAIMQPQLAGAERIEGRTILMIDRSASMNAMDGAAAGDTPRSRLDAARAAARDRVESLYAGGLFGRSEIETMIITLGERAEVVTRFTRSREELLRAIDRITPSDGRTHLTGGLQLARAYMTNTDPESNRPQGNPATLEVFTDGRFDDLDELVLRGEQLIYHEVGRPGGSNATVATVSVTRPFDAPSQVEVFASLLTYDPGEITTDVELRVNDRTIAVQEITIPAGSVATDGRRQPGRANVVFSPFEQTEGAVVTVRLIRDDLLAADDEAVAVVPPPKQLDVLFVSDREDLLEPALEGLTLRSLTRIAPADWAARMEGRTSVGVDVVVGNGWAPPEDLMPAGRYLILGAIPPTPDLLPFGESDRQLVLRVDREHPVMRYVNLDDLLVSSAEQVQPGRAARVLVQGTDGPLVIESGRDGRSLITVTFDPMDSTWPLQRSFVTFLFNAVDHLGRLGATGMREGLIPGDAIATRLPATARGVTVERPDGERLTLPDLDPARFSWGPADRAGIYTLRWSGSEAGGGDEEQGQRMVAVNLAGEQEVDIEPAANIELGSDVIAGVDAGEAGYTPLWSWAVGLALALLMIEWIAWTRRTRV